jgi:hypothetical protein
MTTEKIRFKVGPHEFEAEGEPESVKEHLAAWREMIASSATKPHEFDGAAFVADAHRTNGKPHGTGTVFETPMPPTPEPLPDEALTRIFRVDAKRGLVTLTVHPMGEARNADAVLLVLLGFKKLLSQDEILVGRIKDALDESGIRVDRVDRTIDGYVRSGYLLKAGLGKGGKYRLTNVGTPKAEAIGKSLAEQMM